MKLEFIRRGAATRLILIFAGWSTDLRYYSDCVIDGWDTAVVSDYRDLDMPPVPDQYSTVYLFAYSLGVYAASISNVRATVNIAVCGTEMPVSDKYGIPEAIFQATADGLSDKTLLKFHIRMAGGKSAFESIKDFLPVNADIQHLKDELYSIKRNAQSDDCINSSIRWHRTFIAKNDLIFPCVNQKVFWKNRKGVDICFLDSSHAIEIARIVRNCIPDPSSIGEGFKKSLHTYSSNAPVQTDICVRIGKKLREFVGDDRCRYKNLLEIGVGDGLLTREWSRYIRPSSATFVDLFPLAEFGVALKERYIIDDAELWLEASDEKFDIILSSSAMQWFANPVGFINIVKGHLNPGGVAILSTFVKGNLIELDSVRTAPIIYHTEEEYKMTGLKSYESWTRLLEFDDAKEMLIHLKKTGVTPASVRKENKEGSTKSSHRFSDLPTNLTYRPFLMVITADSSQ